MSTVMACVDTSMMGRKMKFMRFLENAQRFEILDGQLQVYGSEGEALTFVHAE